jgi:hypothetical protein
MTNQDLEVLKIVASRLKTLSTSFGDLRISLKEIAKQFDAIEARAHSANHRDEKAIRDIVGHLDNFLGSVSLKAGEMNNEMSTAGNSINNVLSRYIDNDDGLG